MKYFFYLSLLFLLISSCSTKNTNSGKWEVYGGGKENRRYSDLTEIDTNNVIHLNKAWEFHTGDTGLHTQMQYNAIVVNNLLYAVSPTLKLIALNPATGKQDWILNLF